jgi:uncharacterized repeat protein (TIGR04138 family)
MLCQKCHEREATIHLTQIFGDKMAQTDLCDVCGKEIKDAADIPLTALTSGTPTDMMLKLILASDTRYTRDAYLFVQDGLFRTCVKQSGSSKTMPAHISGAELLEGLREFAIEKFGKQAKVTLNNWGVFKCVDFGEIVFNLIEAGLLAKQENDTKADFQNGYDFDTAFPV